MYNSAGGLPTEFFDAGVPGEHNSPKEKSLLILQMDQATRSLASTMTQGRADACSSQ